MVTGKKASNKKPLSDAVKDTLTVGSRRKSNRFGNEEEEASTQDLAPKTSDTLVPESPQPKPEAKAQVDKETPVAIPTEQEKETPPPAPVKKTRKTFGKTELTTVSAKVKPSERDAHIETIERINAISDRKVNSTTLVRAGIHILNGMSEKRLLKVIKKIHF